MHRALPVLFAAVSALPAAVAASVTGDYFPLVDGARYEYVFMSGPRASASTVVHAGQTWGGVGGLTAMHTTFVCRQGSTCNPETNDFFRMDSEGLHHFGGTSGTTDGSQHFSVMLGRPDLVLDDRSLAPMMMGAGMGGGAGAAWQSAASGMSTMMGAYGYTSSYQAMAVETVVTPAGAFPNALRIHERRGTGDERDVWYAPNVGIVRWVDPQGEAQLTRMTMPGGPAPRVAMAVEYYNPGLDHYFVTADPTEIGVLDTGRLTGWQRTGMGFNVVAPNDTVSGGALPVCRYYGKPEYGLDTHFYSASAAECEAVARNWPMQWTLESSNVFRMDMPDATGACPDGTSPIYRTWNGRTDSNHRYTPYASVQAMMTARGHVAEGYGSAAVAMCSPR